MTDSSRPGLDALPKSWDPGAVESDLYEGWVNAGYFKADASSREARVLDRPAAAERDGQPAHGPRAGTHA